MKSVEMILYPNRKNLGYKKSEKRINIKEINMNADFIKEIKSYIFEYFSQNIFKHRYN